MYGNFTASLTMILMRNKINQVRCPAFILFHLVGKRLHLLLYDTAYFKAPRQNCLLLSSYSANLLFTAFSYKAAVIDNFIFKHYCL